MGLLRTKQKALDFGAQQCYQRWVHEFVVVWNVEADHALVPKVSSEPSREFCFVSTFHHEDEVGPLYKLRG